MDSTNLTTEKFLIAGDLLKPPALHYATEESCEHGKVSHVPSSEYNLAFILFHPDDFEAINECAKDNGRELVHIKDAPDPFLELFKSSKVDAGLEIRKGLFPQSYKVAHTKSAVTADGLMNSHLTENS